MMKAIAIDDEPPALKLIENFCNKVDFISLKTSFTRPSEAYNYLQKSTIDLLFLDIQMPSVSGIDFYRTLSQEIMVIFTTAHSKYAVEGFNLSAIDYLLKPYTFERFLKAVKKANDYFEYLHNTDIDIPPYIFVRADYNLIKVNLSDILFIQGFDDYVKIHLINSRVIVTRMTLKAIHEKLPSKEFVRIHRSYIIPKSKVEKVHNKILVIGSEKIPVGGSFEEIFNLHFKL